MARHGSFDMRALLVVIHRWFGLGMALFLFQAGVTGALIAWDHELDALLFPELYEAAPGREPSDLMPPLELARTVEQNDPRFSVTFLPLSVAPGEAVKMSVTPKIDPATQKPYELGFDEIGVDPSNGAVQARREWGKPSLSREQLMPFLYRLHYSLHLPALSGVELGMWLMGAVALVWVLDAFIALWISFPSLKSWRKSFAFRFDKGGYRLNFDLHRSGGVWAWLLLLPLAVTAVSMNLGNEIVRPVVSWFSPLAPSPFASREAATQGMVPTLDRQQVLARALSEAERRGISDPAGGMFYSPDFGVYGVGFYTPGNDHGDGGLGNPWLYIDGKSGELAAADLPGRGSAGDVFMQLQFPLHSGRILGAAGRVLITLLGLVVSMLSVTGLVIWARKRKVRVLAKSHDKHAEAVPAAGVRARPEPTA